MYTKPSNTSSRDDSTETPSATTSKATFVQLNDILFPVATTLLSRLRVLREMTISDTAALQTLLREPQLLSGRPHIESCLRSLYNLQVSIELSMEAVQGLLYNLRPTEPTRPIFSMMTEISKSSTQP